MIVAITVVLSCFEFGQVDAGASIGRASATGQARARCSNPILLY